MALPVLQTPTYEVTLPLSKKKLTYRPFLVREQKILLMAVESGEVSEVEKSVKTVLKNCTLTDKVDIEKLPVVDVEYYFLQLRARSVGEIVEARYNCENEVAYENGKTKKCNNTMETSWNLLEVKLDTSNLPDDIIQLTPETSIKFNYPDYSLASKMTAENASEMALEVVINSIDYIYDGKNSYYASELKREELIDFIESLNMEQYQKIENFFNSLPTLKQNLKIKCKKCGFEHDILIEGLESFFG